MACAGCVLADPPEHGRATQTPPILFAAQADPPVFQVLEVEPNDSVLFNVPIRSEDVGEPLLAELVLDYSIVDPPRLQKAVPVTAGTFEDTKRTIDVAWDVPSDTAAGCRLLTLWVTHNSNLDVRSLDDVATVTWAVSVGDSSGDPNTLASCPKPN
jgi:hypothetical protein